MVVKIVFISIALIIAVGLSTWALAWAYRKYIEETTDVERAKYERDEAMIKEAEREHER